MQHKLNFIALIFPILIACSPEQINSAINACRSDASCYVIIDDAIQAELEGRGITGGSMTNVELENVYQLLEAFYVSEAGPTTPGLVALINQFGYEGYQMSYYVQRMLYHIDSTGIPNDIFNFRSINQDTKQRVIHQGDKYLIYKIGYQQFRFEVYQSRAYILTIDLDLQSFYWNDVKFESPLLLLERMLSGYYTQSSSKIESYPNMYFLDALKHAAKPDYGLGVYSENNVSFYHKNSKKNYSLFLGASITPSYQTGGYEAKLFGYINAYGYVDQTQGIAALSNGFSFVLNETFTGTFGSFFQQLILGQGIEILPEFEIENNAEILTEVLSSIEDIVDLPFVLFVNES